MSLDNTRPSLYYYQPSVPVAAIGAGAFAGAAALLLWRFTQRRAWYFWAMYVGLSIELVGFAARLLSVCSPSDPNPFVISYLALILGPTFMAAACYATFGRILWWITPPQSHCFRLLWCPTRLITPFFVLFDLCAFLIQLLGAGAIGTAYSSKDLSANRQQERARLGRSALMFGFALQLICFGMFVVVSTRFLVVSRRWSGEVLRYSAPPGMTWTRLNWAVNIATLAIAVRAVYRMVEFSAPQAHSGYLLEHEWPFWVLDAVPTLGVFLLFIIVYPGQHLPPAFLTLWFSTRTLRNQAKSMPPAYDQRNPRHCNSNSNIARQSLWI